MAKSEEMLGSVCLGGRNCERKYAQKKLPEMVNFGKESVTSQRRSCHVLYPANWHSTTDLFCNCHETFTMCSSSVLLQKLI